MGLNAAVCCNCIKEGKAPPHPFSELLAFDNTGEPTLKSDGDGDVNLKLWLNRLVSHKAESGSSRKHANQYWILTALRPPGAQIYRSP
jgi:hypothetical protein